MSNNTEKPAYRAVKTWHDGKPVYVAEQPRGEATLAQLNQRSVKPWVGLTDEEIQKIWRNSEHMTINEVCRAIEAKLKEKNGF